MRDASCRRLAAEPQHGGDVAPAVEATQADLAADHEAEEQDQRGVLGGQRALRLHVESIRKASALNGLPVDRVVPVSVLDPYFYR